MKQIKGMIFDFDGTLFDSMRIWETVGEDYLASLGIQTKQGLNEALSVMSIRDSARYMKAAYALPMTEEKIMEGVNHRIEDFYLHQVQPKEGILALLQELKRREILMSIATATDRYLIEGALSRCGLLSYFKRIFTCTEVGAGKESPLVFETARECLGFPRGEVAVVEDASYAAETAKKAGFYVIGVYDPYERQEERLIEVSDLYLMNYIQTEGLWTVLYDKKRRGKA